MRLSLTVITCQVSLLLSAVVPLEHCFLKVDSKPICLNRGDLDLNDKRLLIDNSFDSAQILGVGLTGMSRFALQRQSGALIYSLPSLSYNTNPNSVETFSVHLGRHDQPVGLAVSLRPALGSVLTKVALVRVVRPIHAPGPILSDKDVKVDAEDEKEEQAIEEPSFIRKYWWVIVGAMLLSSFFGPAEAGRPNQGAGSK